MTVAGSTKYVTSAYGGDRPASSINDGALNIYVYPRAVHRDPSHGLSCDEPHQWTILFHA